MRNKMLAAGMAAGMMVLAGPASAADYIINFSTSQVLFGSAQTGNATITTSDTLTSNALGLMGYKILSITGMLGTSAINGLSGFQGSDNYFYKTGNFVDASGLGFTTVGGTSASLYFASSAQRYQLTTTSPFTSGYVTATATPAVPEPAVWATLMLGFGGVGFALRRRKAAIAAVSFD